MPDDPSNPLPWNEDNLSKAITDLYLEAETNETLRGQLMADPFQVLSSRIEVPEEYRGGVFARERNQKTLILYVPAAGAMRTSSALPEGTTEVQPTPDYEILCTYPTDW